MMQRLLAGGLTAILAGVVWLATWLHRSLDWTFAAAVLTAAAVPVAIDAAVLALQFTIAGSFRRRSRPDAQFPLAASIRAWAGEVVASLRTFFYAQIRYGHTALPSAAHADRVPVLLVHGYFCNRGIWVPFARWLAARGHAVDSVNLEPVFGSIDDFAPIVAHGVQRLSQRTGAARVAIVAHSMGGLVVRAYLGRYGRDSVCSVVTLGTPHRGTWIARLGYGGNVRQMRPGGEWLQTLETGEARQAGAAASDRSLFTVILSEHDNIVFPQSTQTLPGATTRTVTARGHVELAYDPGVWGLAATAIDAHCGSGLAAGAAVDAPTVRSSAVPAPAPLRNGSPASAAAARPDRQ